MPTVYRAATDRVEAWGDTPLHAMARLEQSLPNGTLQEEVLVEVFTTSPPANSLEMEYIPCSKKS